MEIRDYHVRTQFDGKDYLKVFEVYYYDEDGNEVLDEAVTARAEGGVTCADLGEESLLSIRFQVESALRAAGIPFGQIEVEGFRRVMYLSHATDQARVPSLESRAISLGNPARSTPV